MAYTWTNGELITAAKLNQTGGGGYDAVVVLGVDEEEQPIITIESGSFSDFYSKFENGDRPSIQVIFDNPDGGYSYYSDWRETGPEGWRYARWYNGMDAAQSCMEEKTILCGHWHCSYGHSKYEGKGSEFGPDADFSPYYGPGVIALDACTAHSGKVNVIVIEDDDLPDQAAEDERFREVTQRILEKHKAAFLELAK